MLCFALTLIFALSTAARAWVWLTSPAAPPAPADSWQRLGDALGARVTRHASGTHRLDGTVDGLSVRISETNVVTEDEYGSISRTFEIRGEFAMRARRHGDGIDTGDPALDDCVKIQGDEAECVALLDRTTRTALARLFRCHAGSVQVHRSYILVELGGVSSVESRVDDILNAILAVATRVSRLSRTETADRLRINAAGDPSPTVRRRNLALLLSGSHHATAVSAAFDGAITSNDPGCRILAAMASGFAGRETVLELADDAALSDALRLRARTWLRVFGAGGSANAALPRGESAWIAACIEWRGRAGDSSEETALLPLLAHAESTVRHAVANALRRLGTRQAIPHLLAVPERFLEANSVRSAALEAVRAIRARVGGDPGSVSIAESELAGALSAAGEAGAVTLVQE